MRSIHIHRDKTIFKLGELPVERFAESLGLPGAPKIKFLNKEIAQKRKNASHIAANLKPQVDKSTTRDAEPESEESGGEDSSEAGSSEEEEEAAQQTDAAKAVGSNLSRFFMLLISV